MTALCQLASDYRGTLPPDGAMLERKWDGFRCLFIRGLDGKPGLWTRNGMDIQGCDHILRQLVRVDEAAGAPRFIDGELVVGGTLATTKKWVESGYRQGGERGTFHAFDMLADAEWRAGGSDQPLYLRKKALAVAIGLAEQARHAWEWAPGTRGRDDVEPSPVELVADEWAGSEPDVIDAANRVWACGGEGIVVKNALAPYQRRRSSAWQKVKFRHQFQCAA